MSHDERAGFADSANGGPQATLGSPGGAGELERVATREGQLVARLHCQSGQGPILVDCQVRPVDRPEGEPLALGPFPFKTLYEARKFLDETALALEYLGCDVSFEDAPPTTLR